MNNTKPGPKPPHGIASKSYSVSLDAPTVAALDRMARDAGHANLSRAIRDAVRVAVRRQAKRERLEARPDRIAAEQNH